MKYVTLGCRIFIGLIFVAASIHKIVDPFEFAVSIRNYMVVPPSWSNIIALTLPWIELGAGLMLILGIQTKPAALLTTAMLVVFFAALVYAYSIGLDIDCGCFSSGTSSEGRVGLYHLVRDALLVMISASVLIADRGEFGVGRFLVGGMRSEPTQA